MGVYDRVMEEYPEDPAQGYEGELIARMTVTEKTDIVDAVGYLADQPRLFRSHPSTGKSMQILPAIFPCASFKSGRTDVIIPGYVRWS